ncbi:TRAP transporter substrate-binding protein DctP [Mangrovicoccus sp. HB161399]|uniref:TRAP transporter substrate-binding protein DctP n=1 Tax=Mangrovicoccus sp. HB161399 TaxID=2720392 RepID=UPI0015520F94|nr:TRAP transporter substrate-binding protein DctP [Mangrovicoccus sp. HB161399]
MTLKTRLAAAVCTCSIVAPALAGAEELVLPSEVAATHWKTAYMQEFADRVEAATDDGLAVKIFPAGQLYSDQEALAALGTGAVQMVWPVSVRLETIAPQTGIINLPFAISDEMMTDSCMSDGIRDMLSAQLARAGLKVLGLLRTADLYFIYSGREITSMEDLEGTKVRVTGGRVVQDTMKALGISPVSMSASEMSTALSQGAIDGIFTSPAGWSEMIGMSGRYAWYVPGFSLLTYAIVVDSMWYDALPEGERTAIRTSIDDITARQWSEAREKDAESLKKMTDQGAVLHVADEAEIERWKALTKKTSASFVEANPEAEEAMMALEDSCGFAG